MLFAKRIWRRITKFTIEFSFEGWTKWNIAWWKVWPNHLEKILIGMIIFSWTKQDWLDFLQQITILYNLYLEDAESKKKSKQDELMLFSNYTSHQNDDNAKEIQNYLTVKFGMILFLAIDFLQRLTWTAPPAYNFKDVNKLSYLLPSIS